MQNKCDGCGCGKKEIEVSENTEKPKSCAVSGKNHTNWQPGAIGISFIVLLLIVSWFIYQHYQEKHLKENLKITLVDYREFIVSTVEDAEKKDRWTKEIDYLLSNFDRYSRKEIEYAYDSIKRQVTRYDIDKAIRILSERYRPRSKGTPVPIPESWNR
jgi:hypothetical protein